MARAKEELRKTKIKEEKERKDKKEREVEVKKLAAEVKRGSTKEAGLSAEVEACRRRLLWLRINVKTTTNAALGTTNSVRYSSLKQ